jgi:hypothetical protein
MLKCVFIFQDPRGACFLFVGRDTWPNVYLASAWYYDASESEFRLWFMYRSDQSITQWLFSWHKKYVDYRMELGYNVCKHWIGAHIFFDYGMGIVIFVLSSVANGGLILLVVERSKKLYLYLIDYCTNSICILYVLCTTSL